MVSISRLLRKFLASPQQQVAQTGAPHMPATSLQNQLQEEIAFREVRRAIETNFEVLFRGAHFGAVDEADPSDIVGQSTEIVDSVMNRKNESRSTVAAGASASLAEITDDDIDALFG